MRRSGHAGALPDYVESGNAPGFLVLSHFLAENRCLPRIKSGAGFFREMLYRLRTPRMKAIRRKRAMRSGVAHLIGLALLALGLAGPPAFAQHADAVLLNGRIVTLDGATPIREALAVRDGR